MSGIRYPFGDANVVVIEDEATSTIEIAGKTIVNGPAALAQNVTISLTAANEIAIGTEVFFDVKQAATGRNLAWGTAGDTIVAPGLTGVALDRDVLTLIWDGTAFVAKAAAWAKIVDAA